LRDLHKSTYNFFAGFNAFGNIVRWTTCCAWDAAWTTGFARIVAASIYNAAGNFKKAVAIWIVVWIFVASPIDEQFKPILVAKPL
jgi:hypothetical protein